MGGPHWHPDCLVKKAMDEADLKRKEEERRRREE
jgi:hypothetical protein